MWIVFLMYALFASVFPIGKLTLHYIDPFFLTGIRMLLAGTILLLFLSIKAPQKIYFHKKHIPILLLLTLCNVFITNALEFWGLQYMESAKTSLIYSLSPFVSILLSYLFLSEKMTKKKWIGLSIGTLGFVPIFISSSNEGFSLPEIAVSISAFTAVIGWIIMKKLIHQMHYPFVTANAFSFILAGIFSLITSAFTESWVIEEWTPVILGTLYIAVIHNVICYNLYAYSLNRFSVSFMTFAGFSNPLFTALFGWLLLGERVGLPFFLSLGLIIFGIHLYSREELKRAN